MASPAVRRRGARETRGKDETKIIPPPRRETVNESHPEYDSDKEEEQDRITGLVRDIKELNSSLLALKKVVEKEEKRNRKFRRIVQVTMADSDETSDESDSVRVLAGR